MSTKPLEHEERIRLLEAHVEIQEQELVAIRAERIEADRLEQSVARLGSGATALGEALLQVDKNAQLLTKLGKELHEVEQKAATKEDLTAAKEEQIRTTLQFRKATLQRIYTTALLLCTALVIGVLAFLSDQDSQLQAQRSICESRNEQVSVIISVLEGSIVGATSPRADQLRSDIERFRALQADCEQL